MIRLPQFQKTAVSRVKTNYTARRRLLKHTLSTLLGASIGGGFGTGLGAASGKNGGKYALIGATAGGLIGLLQAAGETGGREWLGLDPTLPTIAVAKV